MYHKDSGWAEESVFLHQSLMVGRIGGHVDLEKTLHIHGFMYLRLVERVGFHFSARDAPVGIEIQQDGFVGVGLQSGSHCGFQFGGIGKCFTVFCRMSRCGRRIQCQKVMQGGRVAVGALITEPHAADQ